MLSLHSYFYSNLCLLLNPDSWSLSIQTGPICSILSSTSKPLSILSGLTTCSLHRIFSAPNAPWMQKTASNYGEQSCSPSASIRVQPLSPTQTWPVSASLPFCVLNLFVCYFSSSCLSFILTLHVYEITASQCQVKHFLFFLLPDE